VSAIVAVLAGGRGRRMGEPKPLADFGGAPLVQRPLAAAAAAGLEAVVVAKAGTPLPDGPQVWREPDEPTHPLLGIVTALERANGPVVAVACDMPFVPPALLARLAAGPEHAVIVDGRLAPFPARYEPAWLPDLRAALAAEAPVQATLAALEPRTIAWDDAAALRSVDTPEDLAAARDEIAGSG